MAGKMSDEYNEAMRKLGETHRPEDGWRPLTVDGEVIGYIHIPAGVDPREAMLRTAMSIGQQRGQC